MALVDLANTSQLGPNNPIGAKGTGYTSGPNAEPLENMQLGNPKTGNVMMLTYGDKKGGLEGNWNDPDARKSYAKRHRCAEKTDRTKRGYWSCRSHKDFGPGIGRFW